MHAGMVHALREIHRVLKPNGTLIDLRPNEGNRPIEVLLSYATLRAGEIESSTDATDKRAANHAMQQAVTDGLFKLEYDETFDYIADLDTVEDLRNYGKSLKQNILSEATVAQVEALTSDETDDFSIRIRRSMMIARYRKSPL